MSQLDKDLQRQIALFRYGVIADLVHLPHGHRGIGARLKAKAALTYAIPGTDRDRIAANTIRGWLTCYRAGGFEALYPKRRADRGRARRLPEPVVQRLVELKQERPGRSVRQVIQAARKEGIEHHLAPATVYRLLERAGARVRRRAGSAPLCLSGGRRVVDGRRHARAESPARAPAAKDLPDRVAG